jgi:hypothetical protein
MALLCIISEPDNDNLASFLTTGFGLGLCLPKQGAFTMGKWEMGMGKIGKKYFRVFQH